MEGKDAEVLFAELSVEAIFDLLGGLAPCFLETNVENDEEEACEKEDEESLTPTVAGMVSKGKEVTGFWLQSMEGSELLASSL